MAASRRGQPELHVRLPQSPSVVALPDLPPVSALFLIDFDVKAGYTISWKASKPDVELEGVVEYKSLPSGLHTVSEDLIYFVNDGYAGLSAFVNAPVQDTAARNARMLAVGILVPLSYGRLGRAWKHAESLKAIASKLAVDSKDISILEEYWEKNQARDSTGDEPTDEPASGNDPASPTATSKPSNTAWDSRNRSASEGAALMLPGHRLSPFHPAWSLTKFIDTFGPLIFPIHRAALLRKRILISGHAPVEQACNFVYNISVLSNVPIATSDLLPPDSTSLRLRPLFCIGVHDIPFLTEDAKHASDTDAEPPDSASEAGTGWVACTTDSILSKKDTLWDMLITMPPPHTSNAKSHVWPTIEFSNGEIVKATQRDMRRFRSFKAGIARLEGNVVVSAPNTPGTVAAYREDDALLDDAEQVVEPTSWTALAYSGFMWWASAGEKLRSDEAEEAAQDASLFSSDLASSTMGMNMPRPADISASISSLTPRRSSTAASVPLDVDEARAELAIIGYFHRLTTQFLGALTYVIETLSDSGLGDESPMEEDDALVDADEEDVPGRGVQIDSDVIKRMGLDIWSPSDAEFVSQLLQTYFNRQASVEGKGVEVCGIRVC
ncbi:hypothetical protein F5B22DRAFT_583417 [Xylaria bambusicola]|uniref:uncharacterized protein n=1 Tax=Xylaria bambusicola TaxID=326684 RepID=UPI0020074ED8|nr:uncharacterized protein F5B22DRAFT_583417 [Xylaria bambusicola]KAI0528048.1 hypothetical protein F5B22DRAFT_583417 [Xylaria bambusicola]